MKKGLSRREFVKQELTVVLGASLPSGLIDFGSVTESDGKLNSSDILKIENEIILYGRKNNQAWFEPAIGVIPGDAVKLPQVFIRATYLTGVDVGPQFYLKTDDLGKTWTDPILCQNWFKEPVENDCFEEPWFGLFYHKKTKSFLAIGSTHYVQDEGKVLSQKNEKKVSLKGRPGDTVYSLWNSEKSKFEPWNRMKLPPDVVLKAYYNAQFHELSDGTILIPGYYITPSHESQENNFRGVTVLRCGFDGRELRFLEYGSVHKVEEVRGLAEPSIIYFQDRFYMTIRHDLRAYVTSGSDGLNYGDLQTWCFDDGSEFGNYNTQQKWLAHGDKLYLIYNRKCELNNGVFRGRAPLFMAEVDPDRLRIRKNSEVIVFPEKGARMGNFHVADVAENETWIITGEWLGGMFPHSKKGDRFWFDRQDINYWQYIGNLLLARVQWKQA